MTAVVRIFYHYGTTTAAVAPTSGRYSTDSVQMLKQPYLGRDAITATTGAAQSTSGTNAGDKTKLAFIQVQAGKAAHIEVNPPNRTTTADTSSPIYSGDTQIEFGPGWSLSILEAEIV